MEEKCIDIFCWLGDNFFDWFNSLITLFVGVMAYKLQKRIHEANEKRLSDSEREAIFNICKMMESIKEQALENNINSKNFNLSLNDILSYSTLFLNGKVERLVLNFVFYVRSHLENIKIKDEDKIKTSYNVLKDFKVTYEIGQVIKL